MSTDAANDELAAAIRALGDIFIGRLPATITAMQEQLASGNLAPDDLTVWQTLHRQLHTIAGSAGSFGYAQLGLSARTLEHRLNEHFASGCMQDASQRAEFSTAMLEFMEWATANFVTIP